MAKYTLLKPVVHQGKILPKGTEVELRDNDSTAKLLDTGHISDGKNKEKGPVEGEQQPPK